MDTSTAIRFAGLSIASSLFIVCMKGFIGLLTGSLAVAAAALYSVMCAASSAAVFFTLRHNLSEYNETSKKTLLTALVLVGAGGLWIAFASVQNFLRPEPVLLPAVGAVVCGISALINASFGKTIQNMSDTHTPVLLTTNAARLLTSGYVSMVAAIALFLVNITKLHQIDTVAAIGIVLFTIWEAVRGRSV